MKIAIVGFPGCGKSTCFKAITRKTKAETETLDPTKPHLAAVKISDTRLDKLKSFFNPKKITHAEILFEDLPGFHIPGIKEIEAIMEIVGVFSGRDPAKDAENMDIEFMLADLEIINKRLPALEKELKQEKSRAKTLEREALVKCKKFLEDNKPLRDAELSKDEEKEIRGFQFLSHKPIFVLVNTSEDMKGKGDLKKLEVFCKDKNIKSMEFCAKLESEIADLEESERESFLKELGIETAAREGVIALAYGALGYITFFTTKGSETKAWPIKKGTGAIEAAGKIHSDIQKGFIKAEVINLRDLTECGSMAEAKKKALLKLEGKEYIIRDGDIVDFRFSV